MTQTQFNGDQQDIPFASNQGLIHVVGGVIVPPYSLADTGMIYNNTLINTLQEVADKDYLEDIATDVTIFAVQNSAFHSILTAASNPRSGEKSMSKAIRMEINRYVLNGQVAYSNDLTQGKILNAFRGNRLIVNIDDGGDIFVNGSKIVERDVLIREGVVHFIEG